MDLGPILELLAIDLYSKYLLIFGDFHYIFYVYTCHNHCYAMNNYSPIRIMYPDSKNLQIDIKSISGRRVNVGSISMRYRTDFIAITVNLSLQAMQKFLGLFLCQRNALVMLLSMLKSCPNTCNYHCYVMNNYCAIRMRAHLRN